MFARFSNENGGPGYREISTVTMGSIGLGLGTMVGIVISGAGICFVYPEMAKFVAATEDNFNPYAAGALGLAVGVPVTGSASLFGGLCGLCTGWFGAKAVEATKKAVEERWSPEAKRFIGS